MLAEIFMLRIEFLARLTAEPPESRLCLCRQRRRRHGSIPPTGRFASSKLVGTAK